MLTSFVVVLVVGGTSMIKWFEAPREMLVGEPIAVISVAPLGAADPENSGSTPSGPVDMSGTGLESVLPEADSSEDNSPTPVTPVVARPEPATPEIATPIAAPDASNSSPLGDGDEESDDAFAKPLSALPAQSAPDDDAANPAASPDEDVNDNSVAALPTPNSGETVNPASSANATESTSALDGETADEAASVPEQGSANDLPTTASIPRAAEAPAPTENTSRQSPEIPLPVPVPDNSQSRPPLDPTTTSRIDQTNILNDADALPEDDRIRIEAKKRQARQRARARQRVATRAAEARAQQLAAEKAKAKASDSGDWKSDVFGDN